MKARLFISFYQDSNPERQKELEACVANNLKAGFDEVHIVCESEADLSRLQDLVGKCSVLPQKLVRKVLEKKRPTYNDFFSIMRTYEDDGINVLCNTDIYFAEVDTLKAWFTFNGTEGIALALSRWDVQADGKTENAVLFNRADSQDTWIFGGHPKFNASHEYRMGTAGCDNRIAHEMEAWGYRVLNPAFAIKTYHLHLTNIRHYIGEDGVVKDRVPPPYKLVTPY